MVFDGNNLIILNVSFQYSRVNVQFNSVFQYNVWKQLWKQLWGLETICLKYDVVNVMQFSQLHAFPM